EQKAGAGREPRVRHERGWEAQATLLRRQLSVVVLVEFPQRLGGIGDLKGGDDVVMIGIQSAKHQDHPEVRVDRDLVRIRSYFDLGRQFLRNRGGSRRKQVRTARVV